MDVTSPAVPCVTIAYSALLENHGSKKLSTKVPVDVPPLQECPTNRNLKSRSNEHSTGKFIALWFKLDYALIISFKALPALNLGALEAAIFIGAPL